MIDPTKEDVGRKVVYQAGHPGAPREYGVITSFNDHAVFVLYDGPGETSQATSREDLNWPNNV